MGEGEGLLPFMSLQSIFLSHGDCLPDSDLMVVGLCDLPLLLLFVFDES